MSAATVHQQKFPGNTLKAVLIYDDFNAAARAKCVLERAARRAGKGLTCGVRPWRLDVLNHRGADEEEVLADAAGADLIFLVLRSLRVLPGWLMGWLDKWAGCRQVPDAALAFQTDDLIQMPAAVGRELEQFAERHGVSLLHSSNQLSGVDSTDLVHNLQRRETAVTSTLQRILVQPTQFHNARWYD